MNTDNRIIANIYRIVLEPLADIIVSQPQRGFMRGRSMLRNVFDVDLGCKSAAHALCDDLV